LVVGKTTIVYGIDACDEIIADPILYSGRQSEIIIEIINKRKSIRRQALSKVKANPYEPCLSGRQASGLAIVLGSSAFS
jgi:hypothetical protein